MRFSVRISVGRRTLWGATVEAEDETEAKVKAMEALQRREGYTVSSKSKSRPPGEMVVTVEEAD